MIGALLLLSLALGLVLVVGGCPYPRTPIRSGPSLAGWDAAVDWRAAGKEAVGVLAGYLRVDTVNPPGNETRGARYLAALLEREDISTRIVEFAPGRGSLIARLAGRDGRRPLCLISHIDVVPGDPKLWPRGKGPLSGAVDEAGMIWGRGALDMKGLGALEAMTMVWLKRLGVPLERDVILLAVADEEVDNRGMKYVVDKYWSELRCAHAINEGGFGIANMFFEGQTVFAISTGEKGVLWVKMTVRGEGGHGSTPRAEHTPIKLLRALDKLRRRVAKPKIQPSLKAFLAEVGHHKGGIAGFVLQRPPLVRGLLMNKLTSNPASHAAITDTLAITGLDTGGNKPNVVPSEASARLDCRLQPGTTNEMMLAELRELVGHDPDVRFEQLSYEPASQSPLDDPLYRAIVRHSIGGRADTTAGPVLSIGFTDSLYARQHGTHAYGLIPFVIDEAEARTMHGPKERVSVANVERGLQTLFKIVVEVAGDLKRPARRGPPMSPPARRPTSAPVGAPASQPQG